MVVDIQNVEDLRKIALQYGYYLNRKTSKLIKLKPCICGRKQLGTVTTRKRNTYYIQCPSCGRRAENGYAYRMQDAKNEARRKWNKMIDDVNTIWGRGGNDADNIALLSAT